MRILREDTVGIIIDIQERLFPHMDKGGDLLERTGILIKGLQSLGIPLLHTEQYPKGLGHTVPEINVLFEDMEAIEKIAFSCCDEPGFLQGLESLKKKYVIVAGIEAHVCVLQTCLELLDNGYLPFLVTDAIGSRRELDHEAAVQRMIQAGVIPTTVESALLELVHEAGTDHFRAVLPLIK